MIFVDPLLQNNIFSLEIFDQLGETQVVPEARILSGLAALA